MGVLQVHDLIGMTLVEVSVTDNKDEMYFKTDTGRLFRFYHSQDYCEAVSIEDVTGELSDLIGSPLTMAEEATTLESSTNTVDWTFYKFATVKGYVTIRWLVESNGYYSTEVRFEETKGYN